MIRLTLESIPLQLWHDLFFMEIGNLWGSFITLDDSTSKKCRFDLARILVSIKRYTKIPSKIVISHNGGHFEVPISTEPFRDFISFKSDRNLPYSDNDQISEDNSSTDNLSDSKLNDDSSPSMQDVEAYEVDNIVGKRSCYYEMNDVGVCLSYRDREKQLI
ncbi:hypothetical protein CCACVL1_22338 [Corchorus capsularis]|uniref:DUF4283 domain-containing protein n=1 Tax=Corchorus capsularis TaxID=210143 RepID=A0A1R3H025_COCAP|nr:hypothetical protein CCACVL1_22338 [Corchorus capsularis]